MLLDNHLLSALWLLSLSNHVPHTPQRLFQLLSSHDIGRDSPASNPSGAETLHQVLLRCRTGICILQHTHHLGGCRGGNGKYLFFSMPLQVDVIQIEL